MAWKSIADRLTTLPVVLAGPILRRVEKDNVSVWLALKEPRVGVADRLTLEVYDNNSTSTSGTTPILRGRRDTVSLGEHLHVVVLTATLNGYGVLQQGHTYSYNVIGRGVDLNGSTSLCYPGYTLPSFALPPANLNQLRIIHASCRKLHSDGTDALADVDALISKAALTPATLHAKRPHQLFLTGDQIYADDVDPLLLFLIRDLSEGADAALDIDATPARPPGTRISLMNWQERVPIGLMNWQAVPLDQTGMTRYIDGNNYHGELEVGRRSELLRAESGLQFSGEWEVADNHLVKLGEFYAMYLLMWSPVLWPADDEYPEYRNVYSHKYFPKTHPTNYTIPASLEGREQLAQLPAEGELAENPHYLLQKSIVRAQTYQDELRRVQRVLANVPTYMICDDHEITDDWFLDYRWCTTVLNQQLGRRILQNGLTAYTLFQSWGNNPRQFEQNPGPAYSDLGRRFLDTLPLWSSDPLNYGAYDANFPLPGGGGTLDNKNLWESLGIMTGLPDLARLVADRRLVAQNAGRIQHHFYIAWEKHEVLVMDTRTMRAYPGADSDFAVLISAEGLGQQMADLSLVRPTNSTTPVPEVTFLVIATPISGIPNVEYSLTRDRTRFLAKVLRLGRPLAFGDEVASKLNYYTDAEGYAYQQRGLQELYAGICKCVAARQNYVAGAAPGRIVVLSGDVHYGFTNRVEFWASRLFDMSASLPSVGDTHFVLAQLCASALKNSKSEPLYALHKNSGTYGMYSVDERGYDDIYLLQPPVWCGWIPPTNPNTVKRVGSRVLPNGDPAIEMNVTYFEPVIEMSYLRFELQPTTPDWKYRITYSKAIPPDPQPPHQTVNDPATPTTTPTVQQQQNALHNYLAAAQNKKQYLEQDASGSEAVGRNNFGEVFFEWGATEETKFIRHNLWWSWRNQDYTDGPRLANSEFVVLLGSDATLYPEPVFPYAN